MKTIGLLGGMSWESTLGYYRAINEGIKAELAQTLEIRNRETTSVSRPDDPLEIVRVRSGGRHWIGDIAEDRTGSAVFILGQHRLGEQQGGLHDQRGRHVRQHVAPHDAQVRRTRRPRIREFRSTMGGDIYMDRNG